MAGPLSRRKLAMVLWSGAKRPVSHISSTLRPASLSRRRLEGTSGIRRLARSVVGHYRRVVRISERRQAMSDAVKSTERRSLHEE
jgi:hypothetical protein